MEDPKLVPITTCLLLTSMGITGISQASIPDHNNIGAQVLYALMASEANSNTVTYPAGAGGRADTFDTLASSMPTDFRTPLS